MIHYKIENDLNTEEFILLLQKSTLGERRPVAEKEKIEAMLKNANLILAARKGSQLVGVARSLSDFAYCTYLSDLAVDQAFQRQGIGKELIRQTKLAAPYTKLILLAAPKAVDYYPKIGMKRHHHCFYIESIEELAK